jgi:hypothetical protein
LFSVAASADRRRAIRKPIVGADGCLPSVLEAFALAKERKPYPRFITPAICNNDGRNSKINKKDFSKKKAIYIDNKWCIMICLFTIAMLLLLIFQS